MSEYSMIFVRIEDSDGHSIELDPIDFVWNAPEVHPIEESKGDYRKGQKGAIVEFFMWPHADVEKECATLAKMGYLGAKLFPAQEQLMSSETFSNDLNPWYFAYQPVSYRLQGRMGTRDQLRSSTFFSRFESEIDLPSTPVVKQVSECTQML
jgi:alpha-amylase